MEILAGNVDDYFARTGIKGEKTYNGAKYQVWDLDADEFKKLIDTANESYKNDEWWRSSEGSNMGEVNAQYVINNKSINAWDGSRRTEDDLDDGDDFEFPREYSALTEYFSEEIGAGLVKNVCALAVDLARQNNMTLTELFNQYQPQTAV